MNAFYGAEREMYKDKNGPNSKRHAHKEGAYGRLLNC